MKEEEFYSCLKEFYEELLSNQQDLEPEINKIVSENFWELIMNIEKEESVS